MPLNVGNVPVNELQRIRAKRNTDARIRREIAKNKAPLYRNGDLVRVKMVALFSDLRRKVKEGRKKEIIVQYSPDLYRVKLWNRNFDALHEKQQYTLTTLDNQPVLTEFKANRPNKVRGPKRFFATDFIKVGADDEEPNINMEQANALNKIANGTHLIPNRQAEPESESDSSSSSSSSEEEETDPMNWRTKEWNNFLKDKTFEDEGRWKIIKVQYNRKERNYTCDVEQGDDENEMLLHEVLHESKAEPWYRKEFDEVIKKLNKSKK
jgi:hypothetical protein